MERNIFITITAAVFMMMSTNARAEDPQPAWFDDLVQEGSTVKVTFWVNSEHMEQCFLKRMKENDRYDPWAEEDTAYVFANRTFSPDESLAKESYCPEDKISVDECRGDTNCHDCDDDGTDECTSGCLKNYFYEVVDMCVPGGELRYAIEFSDLGEVDWMNISTLENPCPNQDTGGGCSLSGRPFSAFNSIMHIVYALFLVLF